MRRRIVPATAIAALAVAGLTGCTTTASSTHADGCVAPLSPGVLSSSVVLEESTPGAPEITLDTNAEILNAQRSFIEQASDRATVAHTGSILAANIAYFDSMTGELLEATPSFGTDVAGELFLMAEEGGPVLTGLMCSSPGDIVTIAMPPEMSSGSVASPDASLVIVAEIVDVFSGVAEGASRALPFGFPEVATDETGRPGVVLPPQAAPADITSAVRIAGDGPAVTADSMVIGNVLTVSWDGSILKNSWEQGPENFGAVEQIAQSGATFRTELTGQTVGSQIVVIEPGDGSPRVSVIDILAIA